MSSNFWHSKGVSANIGGRSLFFLVPARLMWYNKLCLHPAGGFKERLLRTLAGRRWQKAYGGWIMNVLFIGNSFTYFNAMPDMVQMMADTADLSAKIQMLAYGGYCLKQHTTAEDAHFGEAEALLKDPWDVVVLQEQSNAPALHYDVFEEGVAALMPFIRAAGAKPLFYMTWPYRRNSLKLQNCGMEYGEMQVRLDSGYRRQMQKYEAEGVAVGDMFVELERRLPYFTPYAEDCFHPNVAGSYVAACLFFKTLFGREAPEPSAYCPAGLEQSFAALLRRNMA